MTQDTMKHLDAGTWTDDMWQELGSDMSPQTVSHDFNTVSPSALFMAPPISTPTFSSPGMFDSPSEGGYDTSPMFGGEEEFTDTSGWYSLFPSADSEDSGVAPIQHPQVVDQDDRDSTESPDTSPLFRSTSINQKRSSTSGVRKRSATLPPIVVDDPSDTVAVKRARNTLAARKSRAKKAERMDEMEATIEGLKKEVEKWKSIAIKGGLASPV